MRNLFLLVGYTYRWAVPLLGTSSATPRKSASERCTPTTALACPVTISVTAGRLEAVQYLDVYNVRALAAHQQPRGQRTPRAAKIAL